ncbi:protein pangolin, isoforms A/H/I/S-like [Aphomia sociella]
MPHAHSSSAASSGGDDLGSTDEVKVFKDEGDGEDEKRSSENLLEEKSSLIDWTESEEKSGEPYSGKLSVKSDLSPVFGKFEPHPAASFNMGYLMAPYPYPNGGAHPLPVSMRSTTGLPLPKLLTPYKSFKNPEHLGEIEFFPGHSSKIFCKKNRNGGRWLRLGRGNVNTSPGSSPDAVRQIRGNLDGWQPYVL